jgi:hypothetical protein
MKFKYEINSTDLKRFQIHYLLNSKLVLISIWAIIIFIMASVSLMYNKTYNLHLSIERISFYVLIAFVMLYIVLRKIQNNKKNSYVFWNYDLELKDDTFYFLKNWYVKKIRANSYIRYIENKKYIYLYLTKSYANIIPKYKLYPEENQDYLLGYIRKNIPSKVMRKNF